MNFFAFSHPLSLVADWWMPSQRQEGHKSAIRERRNAYLLNSLPAVPLMNLPVRPAAFPAVAPARLPPKAPAVPMFLL